MLGRKKRSILLYWSIRYYVVLFLSMLVVGATILLGIHSYEERTQRTGLNRMIDDITTAAAERNGKLPKGAELQRWLDGKAAEHGLSDRPTLIIFDHAGATIQTFPMVIPLKPGVLESKLAAILSGERRFLALDSARGEPLLAVSAPIQLQTAAQPVGYAMYMVSKNNVLDGYLKFSLPRMAGWVTLMICGWLIIYAMIRRLVKPIQEVAIAAKQVVEGHYEVKLDKAYKEREIDNLMTSFKEMAEQLRKMENLRAQLLAGVTHELKTPITSISGLAQAIHDRVVVEEEADEFLKYCILECNRLKTMVDDLLDFNSFAAGAIQVSMQCHNLKDAILEIVEIWKISQEYLFFNVDMKIEEDAERWIVVTDIERLKQIAINLLNNARDAVEKGGTITVRLISEEDHFLIQVDDTGKGIPEEDHRNIFEPFYRGSEKKTRIRGLGIGLPFSRMIAQALGGQLVLAKSTSEGTSFSLYLPNGNPVQRSFLEIEGFKS